MVKRRVYSSTAKLIRTLWRGTHYFTAITQNIRKMLRDLCDINVWTRSVLFSDESAVRVEFEYNYACYYFVRLVRFVRVTVIIIFFYGFYSYRSILTCVKVRFVGSFPRVQNGIRTISFYSKDGGKTRNSQKKKQNKTKRTNVLRVILLYKYCTILKKDKIKKTNVLLSRSIA